MSYAFQKNVRFIWKNVVYRVIRIVNNEDVNFEDEQGLVYHQKRLYLELAFFAGELFFVDKNIDKIDSETKSPIILYYSHWNDVPEHLQELAEWRWFVIDPLIDMNGRTRDAVKQRISIVNEELQRQFDSGVLLKEQVLDRLHGLNVVSVYDWMKRYRRSHKNKIALVPDFHRRGGTNKPRIDERITPIIDQAIRDVYLVPEESTAFDVFQDVAAEIDERNKAITKKNENENINLPLIPRPSLSTVTRRINAIDPEKRSLAKLGARETRRERHQHASQRRPDVPFALLYLDSTPGDLILVDDDDAEPLGRFTATWSVDAATGDFAGWYIGFEPSSSWTYMEALYHTILPKPDAQTRYGTEHPFEVYGLPEKVLLDLEKCNQGKHLLSALDMLGIKYEHTPIQCPEAKASMERAIRTMNERLLHKMKGTTFSTLRRRRTYDSLRQACLTLDELHQAVYIEVVDRHGYTFHRGIKGFPRKRYQAAIDDGWRPQMPQSAYQVRVALGMVEERAVHAYGITIY